MAVLKQWKMLERVLSNKQIPYKEELKQWKFPDRVLTNKQIPYKEGLKQWKFLDRVLPKKKKKLIKKSHIRKN